MSDQPKSHSSWKVYILCCADGSLYTGITTDMKRRLKEHNDSSSKSKAAKYTRARQPVTLKYHESFDCRATASRREYEIKRLSRTEKLVLCES